MCVFTPKKAHNCAHRAHLHTSPLCVFLCVCVPARDYEEDNPRYEEDNPRWVGQYLGGRWRCPPPRPNVARISGRKRPTRAGWGGIYEGVGDDHYSHAPTWHVFPRALGQDYSLRRVLHAR